VSKSGNRGGRPSLPSKQEILDFINDNPDNSGKREIARAFGVRSPDKPALRDLLREMSNDGLIDNRRRHGPGRLPPVAVLVIDRVDEDGDLIARPAEWDETPVPHIRLIGSNRPGRTKRGKAPSLASFGVGDRVLARMRRRGSGFDASPIQKLGVAAGTVIGLLTVVGGEARIQPADKKARRDYLVAEGRTGDAEHGELVVATILPEARRHYGMQQVEVTRRIGHMDDPRSVSLIAIHNQGIPTDFPRAAETEAKNAQPVSLVGSREDLRDVPLITIDPSDARDHDDAVWAEADPSADNKGGWHVIVAIADVAHYVQPGTALDKAAQERGNSVYFPDRVIPMLPERLSTTLCSLTPGDIRACLAVHMWIGKDGQPKHHKFVRGLMRSAANLSYEQVQAAMDGTLTDNDKAGDQAASLREQVLAPLYGAYAALKAARDQREPLDLELPERDIRMNKQGEITSVAIRERLDAHRLVEEMMIAANVAAAETLEAKKLACMYRVHEEPDSEKLEALREFLSSLELTLAKGQILRPQHFNRVLTKVADSPDTHLVNQAILRSQSQACYSPVNGGHFGLNLARYAHFTSPIRRYSDVLVHRALVRALGLGDDGLTDPEIDRMAELGEHISGTERRALAAEREATDRYMAAFMAERIGADFAGRISGIGRFGIFVTLDETGADGLIPIRTLGEDYYNHDEVHHALVGERSGETFRLGDQVDVRLAEADPLTGSMRLELLREGGHMPVRKRAGGKGRKGGKNKLGRGRSKRR
jgi:ribonuclease R